MSAFYLFPPLLSLWGITMCISSCCVCSFVSVQVGMTVDEEGFANEMAAQKARSKEAEAARRCVCVQRYVSSM